MHKSFRYGIGDLVYLRPSFLRRNLTIENHIANPKNRIYSVEYSDLENSYAHLQVCEPKNLGEYTFFAVKFSDISPAEVVISRQEAVDILYRYMTDIALEQALYSVSCSTIKYDVDHDISCIPIYSIGDKEKRPLPVLPKGVLDFRE